MFIDDGESELEFMSDNSKVKMSVSDSIVSVYPASMAVANIPNLEKMIIQPIRAQINRNSHSQSNNRVPGLRQTTIGLCISVKSFN